MRGQGLVYILIFLGGACFGSFFYTLALRYISGMIKEDPLKALFSRSMCPSCRAEIGIIYLIPFLGYLITGGKCAGCGKKISLSYPAWEAVYGMTAVAVFFVLGLNFSAFAVYLIIALCICISIVYKLIFTCICDAAYYIIF